MLESVSTKVKVFFNQIIVKESQKRIRSHETPACDGT